VDIFYHGVDRFGRLFNVKVKLHAMQFSLKREVNVDLWKVSIVRVYRFDLLIYLFTLVGLLYRFTSTFVR